MKNLFPHLLAAVLLSAAWQPARAQSETTRQATELAWQTRQQWASAGVAPTDLRISSAYTEASGLLYAYPQQLQAGIPVYNQVVTLVFKSGQLVHHAGTFVPGKAFADRPAAPKVPAAAAVTTAIATLPGHPSAALPALESPSGPDQQQRFAPAGVARQPLVVRLVWAMDKDQVPRLAWNVNVDVLASADWLNIRVDATTGQVLGQDNWTVHEKAMRPASPAGFRTGTSPARAPRAPAQRRPDQARGILTVTPARYIVVPFPGERPDVTAPTTDINPWLRVGAGNAAATYGWHFDGTANYTDTRGNNVQAYDDSLNQNVPGRFATSTGTSSSLVFNYQPDFTKVATLGKNRRAATVNLFYWNNLMHDVLYQYGFTEAAGNFQTDNQGRGGLGGDYVKAEAQDGGGTNNANFATPPDGTSGRMQMYLFTGTTPGRDGDFDNGVITHEYGHGISTRLTGGPANSSCLDNSEQAGEGWSDYFALMMTTNWTTAQPTNGATPRPIGTYAFGQSPTGAGIRRYPYTTNMSVNPLTYADMASHPEVHDLGEIWCVTLWDLTWALVQQQGTIEPNLYNSTSLGGNAVALQLVMQGLKLQPCQPGFLDSRDAILAADNLLYNGQFDCLIKSVFARRGMGLSAVQGSSNSTADQVAAFDDGVLRKFTTPAIGNQFTITLEATAGNCTGALSNLTLSDQLPAGLQYLSSTGGTLGSNNTVSFPNLTFATGQTRTFTIQAQTAAGQGCAFTMPINDDRDANTAGGLTAAVVTGANSWAPSTTRAHSGAAAWKAGDPVTTSDVTLTSALFTPGPFSQLSFYNFYDTEFGYDGGLMAISVNNGASWIDAAPYFVQNGYNAVFNNSTASAGKPCFSGTSSTATGPAAFIQTLLDLSSFGGQSIQVRFQMQTDVSIGVEGWYLDDIQVLSGCGGYQQVQLLSSGSTVLGSYKQATYLTVPAPTPAPALTSLNPTNGPVGTSVTVTGTDLANATGLTLNGTAVALANITANTATGLTFTVPAGATTGLLTVTTAGNTSNGLTFTVIQDLLINTPGQTIAAGTYRNITIANNGVGSLPAAGTVSVTGAFVVQSGGRFNVGAGASPVGGPGTFALNASGYLYSALPLYATGAQGAVQLGGSRTFASDATYEFGATATATGPGLPATVSTLVLSPTGTVQLSQPVALRRELRLSTGILDLNAQVLTLLSDAATTAQVNQDGATTTGTVSGGSATVQRYIVANGNAGLGYRQLSSPVLGNRLDDLAVAGGYQPVFNPAYNNSPTSNALTPFPNVFGFDPARIGVAPSSYGGFDQGYYSPATGTSAAPVPDLFIAGRGYAVSLTAAQAVDFVGPLRQASLAMALPRGAGTASPDDGKGWHLLGNPFASSFALASLDNTPGVDNAKYIFQSVGPYTGSYQTVLTGLSGQPLLALGQGFFVRVNTPGTTPTLAFALAGRRVDFTTNSLFHRATAETRPLLELELATASGTLRDRSTLYADAQATPGLDPAYDAVKLPNPHGLNLAQQAAGRLLALNGLPALTTGTVVPLSVGVPAAGAYALLVGQLLNLPAGITLVLVDTELNTRTDLATLPATGYAFSVTATQAAALITGRFFLNVTLTSPLATTAGQSGTGLTLYPNPARTAATLMGALPGTRATVYDALGREVTSAPTDAAGTATLKLPAGLAAGVYVVRAGLKALRLTVE